MRDVREDAPFLTVILPDVIGVTQLLIVYLSSYRLFARTDHLVFRLSAIRFLRLPIAYAR